MILCACAGWSESAHFDYVRGHGFISRGIFKVYSLTVLRRIQLTCDRGEQNTICDLKQSFLQRNLKHNRGLVNKNYFGDTSEMIFTDSP